MYTGLLHFHHWLPFLFWLLIAAVLVQNFLVWKGNNEYTPRLARNNKLLVILAHIQVLVGLVMLFSYHTDMFEDMGSLMKNSDLRFKFIEHPMTMIIGAVLMTVGHSKSKKLSGENKAKAIVIWFGIAAVLIALRFPWNQFLAA